ncbi:MAG: MFS transporter [Candidatus Jordarchaeaceae archaeon]
MSQTENRPLWFWVFTPVNASIGIFLTLLPIYVLNLGGNVVEVGIVTSSFLLSQVPSFLVWGCILDLFPSRKKYIVFSYITMSAILALLYLYGQLRFLPFFVAVFGFIFALPPQATNLLIMEIFTKTKWPKMLAEISFVSITGYVFGVIIGIIWSSFYELKDLIILSAIPPLISGILVLKFVHEPTMISEKEVSKEVILHKAKVFLDSFAHLMRLHDYKVFLKVRHLVFFREAPILYFSVFVFNIGWQIYVTSYIPSLKQRYILDNQIFLITLSHILAQAFILHYINRKRIFEHHTTVDIAKLTLKIVIGTFIITGAEILLFNQSTYIAINLVIYAILGGSIALYNPSASSLVFGTLSHREKSRILGIYSAAVLFCSFTGAFISGYLTNYFGYFITFLTAAILTAISLYLVGLSAKIGERARLLHDIITYGQFFQDK